MIATILEKRAGLRHRLARVWGPLYRRGFAAFGRGSVLIRPLMLQGVRRIAIGRHNLFRDGAWLGTEPGGELVVGDHNYFGHRLHLHSADPVTIGSRCVFADDVFVSSADHARDDRHGVVGTGPVHIGDDVFIGQRAVILGGVTIGAAATVGAGAVVKKDVPSGAVVAGVPARVIAP